MSGKSKFAWWAATLFAIVAFSVVTLDLLEQNGLIDRRTEGLLRLVINGGLGAALVAKCFRSSLSRSLHYAIVVTVVAGTGDSLFNYTEDVPQLNHVPLLGFASEWRDPIESVFAAGWMVGGFAIVYAAIMSVQRGQAELCRRVDALSQSENKLRQSNARLALALQQLRETQQQLVKRERISALGQMASGVAHDRAESGARWLVKRLRDQRVQMQHA